MNGIRRHDHVFLAVFGIGPAPEVREDRHIVQSQLSRALFSACILNPNMIVGAFDGGFLPLAEKGATG